MEYSKVFKTLNMESKFKKLRIGEILNRKKPMDLQNLIAGLFLNNQGLFMNKYPKRVGQYCLYKEIEKVGSKKDFSICIYKDKYGKKVFAKAWNGKQKDFRYNTLINEIRACHTLNKVKNRMNANEAFNRLHVNIPRLLDVYESKNQLIVFFSFEKGELATLTNTNTKIDAYLRSVEFLVKLGQAMTTKEKTVFSNRNLASYIFLYPLFLIKSITNFPEHSWTLLRGVPIVAKAFYFLSLEQETVLAHRDLHFNNMLVDGKTIVLIDFQYMVFTELVSDFAATYRHKWNNDNSDKLLYKTIMKRINYRKNFEAVFVGLLLCSATHGLIDKSFSNATTKKWLDLIKLTIKNKNKINYRFAI